MVFGMVFGYRKAFDVRRSPASRATIPSVVAAGIGGRAVDESGIRALRSRRRGKAESPRHRTIRWQRDGPGDRSAVDPDRSPPVIRRQGGWLRLSVAPRANASPGTLRNIGPCSRVEHVVSRDTRELQRANGGRAGKYTPAITPLRLLELRAM